MCQAGTALTAGEALAALGQALDALNAADPGSLPTVELADLLRGLERAEAKHVAARARVLAAFAAQSAHESDGQGSARAWLMWQARVTKGAAAGAVGWARRLAEHPAVADALAAGEISASWARQICEWSDLLPVGRRGDADAILTGAATGGALLSDLATLAQEMHERSQSAQDRSDQDRAIRDERGLWLGLTLGGAGRLAGDLTPDCAAALTAVLEALAKKAGPEDRRSAAQRRHDALAEACRRLAAAGMLPDRAGQPSQIHIHVTLAQLRALPGADEAEEAWIAARAGQPGWLTGTDAERAACDAAVTTTVIGHIDTAALDRMAEIFLALHRSGHHPGHHPGQHEQASGLARQAPPDGRAPGGKAGGVPAAAPAATATPGTGTVGAGTVGAGTVGAGTAGAGTAGAGVRGTRACGCVCGQCACPPPLSPQTLSRLRAALLRAAADTLSGPAGLASHLRRTLLAPDRGGPPDRIADLLAAPSLPLDIPLDATGSQPAIPAHLRRAATLRHPRCAFPGCAVPASACEIHHVIPRSRGGPTSLCNLVPLCVFHHQMVIHTWGWTLRLNPDGTTTAISPDGRTLQSHAPPQAGR